MNRFLKFEKIMNYNLPRVVTAKYSMRVRLDGPDKRPVLVGPDRPDVGYPDLVILPQLYRGRLTGRGKLHLGDIDNVKLAIDVAKDKIIRRKTDRDDRVLKIKIEIFGCP